MVGQVLITTRRGEDDKDHSLKRIEDWQNCVHGTLVVGASSLGHESNHQRGSGYKSYGVYRKRA